MTECKRERIRCVIRARWFLESKQCLCHPLHLGFCGFSVTDNRLFHLGRCIRSDRAIRIRGCKLYDTFNFTYGERTTYVFSKENVFNYDTLNGAFGNQIGYGIVNLFQPYLRRCFGTRSDVSVIPQRETIRVRFNHAVSSIRNARVNAKNNQFLFLGVVCKSRLAVKSSLRYTCPNRLDRRESCAAVKLQLQKGYREYRN